VTHASGWRRDGGFRDGRGCAETRCMTAGRVELDGAKDVIYGGRVKVSMCGLRMVREASGRARKDTGTARKRGQDTRRYNGRRQAKWR
jgi:hypothetical protein